MTDIVVRVTTDQGVHIEEEEQSRGTKRPASWREELEQQSVLLSLKERVEKLESERSCRLIEEEGTREESAERRQNTARFFLETIHAFKGDGSGRDQIQQMDLQRSLIASLHRATIRMLDENTTQQGTQPAAIQDAQPEHHEITISEVAARILGRPPTTGELQKFGRRTAQLYRQKYNSEPPRSIHYVDGAPRQVNSYSTKDLELIEKAVHEVMN